MQQPPTFWRAAVLLMAAIPNTVMAQPAPGLKVPPGFEVTEYAGSELANDIYTMTVDPKGRIVVAAKGYIRILEDTTGKGKADKSILFADTPKDGAMGLLWEGDTLYVTGDGGLRKFAVAADGNHALGPSQLIRAMKTGREHGAHAIQRGPDGWLYILCGNNTDIDTSYAELPTSPVQKPVAGVVLRFTPDLKKCEIVAHGFRNPYGMDFNTAGELFTYESDNERCVSLPWYEPTRFYHVIPGGCYGWLNPQHDQFWRCPPWFVDVVAPAVTLGRGSPTGVACYRHVSFPPKYRGGMFAADWTFGKIYFLELVRDGSSYTCKKEVFLESVGDNGFAPTALVVHPKTGDLFVSIGGRGTRGAVYRIHYKDAPKSPDKAALAKLQIAPRSLDWQPALKNSLLEDAKTTDKQQCLRALQLLARHAGHFKTAELQQAIMANWNDPDRSVRQAAAALIGKLPEPSRQWLAQKASEPREHVTCGLARYATQPKHVLQEILTLLGKTKDANAQLEAVRVLQLALGDLVAPKMKNLVWEGYSPRKPLHLLQKEFGPLVLTALRPLFPTDHLELGMELARTLAMLEDGDGQTLEKVANTVAKHADDPVSQVHYLIVLSRLGAARSTAITNQVAAALLGLDAYLHKQKRNIDSHWPLRLKELCGELARKDPKLNSALLAHKEFGRPAHSLFALAPGFDVPAAAAVFLKKAKADSDYPWNADLITIVGKLPQEQAFSALRPLWGKAGMDAALLPILAKHPAEQDHAKFVSGLKSPQLALVQTSLNALNKLPGKADGEEVLALLTALNRLPKDKAKELAQDIAARLEQTTGQKHGADRKAWLDWFEKTQPQLAAKLTNIDGIDVAVWKKRFTQLKLDSGDAPRGAALFQKANCAACHSGGQALGPDLHGVAKRFSPEDLFWAIVQPSRDVPERYQTTLFETHDGKIYQGMIVYQATDGVLLQTSAAVTVRIAGENIASQQTLPNSLMPAGLLDTFSDQEIADLFAFLRSQ